VPALRGDFQNSCFSRGIRILLLSVAVLAVAFATICAGFYWAMLQPPDVFGRIVSRGPLPLMIVLPFETLWRHARAGALRAGDPAPDFHLPTLDRAQSVRLSSFRGSRPVVLVFGSYT
jgi:hypothetical protein